LRYIISRKKYNLYSQVEMFYRKTCKTCSNSQRRRWWGYLDINRKKCLSLLAIISMKPTEIKECFSFVYVCIHTKQQAKAYLVRNIS